MVWGRKEIGMEGGRLVGGKKDLDGGREVGLGVERETGMKVGLGEERDWDGCLLYTSDAADE